MQKKETINFVISNRNESNTEKKQQKKDDNTEEDKNYH